MKRFLKLTMALTVATILSTSAFAQTTPSKTNDHKAHREQKFKEATKRLNLSADQEQKLKGILATNKAEMKAIREANKDASKDEKRALMIGQFKKLDGQITAMLDAKQIETYKLMKEEKKKEMQQKREAKMKEKEEMEDYQGIF